MSDNPADSDANLKLDGLSLPDRLRALRAKFGLSLSEAKAVTDITDGKAPAAIGSHAELIKALGEILGYCTCSYNIALPFLRDVLRLIAERTDNMQDHERFLLVSSQLEDLLNQNGSPAMRSWFIHTLDNADLVMHGFNLYDLSIMNRGRWLLAGLERFPEPPPTDVEEAGSTLSTRAE